MSLNKACDEKLLLEVERSIITAVSYTSKPYEDMSDAERARGLYSESPETTIHAFNVLVDQGLITSSEQRLC